MELWEMNRFRRAYAAIVSGEFEVGEAQAISSPLRQICL